MTPANTIFPFFFKKEMLIIFLGYSDISQRNDTFFDSLDISLHHLTDIDIKVNSPK
jgi:hypothetical protein